jgi:ubiquinone/menaquinone biosynthesis C-methylase UbiE
MERIPEPEVMDDAEEARVYDLADFSDVNREIAEAAASRIEASFPAVIDLGAGPCEIPIRLAKSLKDGRIVALDASSSMLERGADRIAKQSRELSIRLVKGDAKKTPFESGSFDAAISNSLLHHLDDPIPFWREAGRLSRRGGLIFVEDLFRPESPDEARRIVDRHAEGEPKLLKDLFYQSLLAAFTIEEIVGQIARAGLSYLDVAVIDDRHVRIYGLKGSW